MNIRLPYGYTLRMNFDVRLTPPPVYCLYLLDRDNQCYRVVMQSTDHTLLEHEAKRLLEEKYGKTDDWDWSNDSQWVHPNSPSAKRWSERVDALISRGEMKRD